MQTHIKISVNNLRHFIREIFAHYSVPSEQAADAADVLLLADLRGIDSHGVSRLSAYVNLLAKGRVNPRPKIRVVKEFDAVARVDGDNGLGLVVGPHANRICLEKAASVGVATVNVFNSNHYGIAGYYPLQAAGMEMIAWSLSNSGSLVAPFNGAQRMLGTNPFAIAFPCADEPPVVVDLATSVTSLGKIELALQDGSPLPPFWAVNSDGSVAQSPQDVFDGAAILPLGSTADGGGHKGYCLAGTIDILAGILSGASWGPFTPQFIVPEGTNRTNPETKRIGHMFGALRIDSVICPIEFKTQMDGWVRAMRSTKQAKENPVLVPGDPERAMHNMRIREGIPISPKLLKQLRQLSKETGVCLDESCEGDG